MINVNKLLLSFVLVAAVAIKAEDTTKTEVAEQNSEIVAELKKLYANVTAQENIDVAKDYTNKALEQTEKVFTQYPMYVPAVFFFGRASMAGKTAQIESISKDVSKALRRVKSRNMYVAAGLLAGHFYYNRNDKAVQNERAVAVSPVVLSKPTPCSNNIEA